MMTADEVNRDSRRGKRWKTSRTLTSFCLLWGLLILGRVCCDVFLYCCGGTITVRPAETYDYLIRFPPGYTDFSGPRPLLVFLHGAGEAGLDVKQVGRVDPFHYAAGKLSRKDFPFIVLSPVVPQERHGWDPVEVKAMIDDFLRHSGRLKVDPNRIYLTGFSMGGFGTFETAGEYPDFFAAAAPLAGGGNPNNGERYISLPIRAYHGDADESVPYHYSVEMIKAIKDAGNQDAGLVTLPGAGHQICSDVYSKPEIYRWFLKRRK